MPKPVIPIVSSSSTVRQDAAKARLVGVEPPLLIVAASRGAADEFALALAADRGATFGVTRMGLTELVAKLAVPALAKRGLTARVDGERKPYRIHVGRYVTRADAVAALARLKKKGHSGFVTELDR